MSETTAATVTEPTATEAITDAKPAQAKTTDWEAEAKKWEPRAKENFEKAKAYDALVESQKTDAQRMQDALSLAQSEAAEAKSEALRFRLASEHGVPANHAALFLTGTTEEKLTQQAQAYAAMAANAPQPPPGPRADLSQGASGGAPSGDPARDFAAFITAQTR